MAQKPPKPILNQLKPLEPKKLQQLNQTTQNHLADEAGIDKLALFHQALINSGLVKQIKQPSYDPISERRLIQIEGKPISETIIEERC